MKIRTDFVTNSSSSSFVTVSVNGAHFDCDKFEGDGWGILMFSINDCIKSLSGAKTPKDVAAILRREISWCDFGADEDAVSEVEKDFETFIEKVGSKNQLSDLGVLGGYTDYSSGDGCGQRIAFDFDSGRGAFSSFHDEMGEIRIHRVECERDWSIEMGYDFGSDGPCGREESYTNLDWSVIDDGDFSIGDGEAYD